MNSKIYKVFHYIEQNNMLGNCDNLIVGVSGGADSVCLISILKEYIEYKRLSVSLLAVHINHNIRQTAKRDEDFTKALCDSLGIRFKAIGIDALKLAKKSGQSVEEAGRNERYRIFNECAKELVNSKIAVAHHLDDQAETVLMNLFRGSSINGLKGIQPVRDNIIRPLLCISRKEILEILDCKNQTFVTDETNSDNTYTRNFIRNVILPQVSENVNQRAVENINSCALEISMVNDYIEKETSKAYEKYVSEDLSNHTALIHNSIINCDEIIRRRVIYNAIVRLSKSAKDIYNTHVSSVEQLLQMQVSKSVSLCFGIKAVRTYDGIVINPKQPKQDEAEFEIDISDENAFPKNVKLGIQAYIHKAGNVFIKSVSFELINSKLFNKNDNLMNNLYIKAFDYDKIKGSLQKKANLKIRRRRTGDTIVISKTGNTKKLKSELIDRKIPANNRRDVVLLCEDSNILWALGVRRSEDYLVSDNTESVLLVKFQLDEGQII